MSDHIGRGPTRARTYLQDDLVSVVVRDSLTKGERSLLESFLLAPIVAAEEAA